MKLEQTNRNRQTGVDDKGLAKQEQMKLEQMKLEQMNLEQTKLEQMKQEQMKLEQTNRNRQNSRQNRISETGVDETRVDETRVDEQEQMKQEQPNQGINHHTDHLWSFSGNVCHCLLPHVYINPCLRTKSCHISFFIQDSALLHVFKIGSLTHKVNYAHSNCITVQLTITILVHTIFCFYNTLYLRPEYSWYIKPPSLVINSWKQWRKLVS